MGRFRDKLALVKRMFKMIDIEPFVLLYCMSYNSCDVARTQLIQDKLCLNKYNESRSFCIELKKNKGNEVANNILGDLAQYLTYTTLITTLPGVIFVLFMASWMDSYIHGRKIVLSMGILGAVGWYSLLLLNSLKFELDISYVLLAYIPPMLVGGRSCIWMTVYSFMSNNTSKEYRFLKFTSFELAVFIAKPLSIFIGGVLLGSGNHGPDGNIHYYERVFLFSLCCAIVAFVNLLFAINEKKAQNKKKIQNIENQKQEDSALEMSDNFKISKMFNLKNLKDIFSTAVKVRPNKRRGKIWLLYLSMNVILLTDAKTFSILFPYTEKVYGWNAKEFSNVKSLASIIQALALPITSLILSARLKLRDSIVCLIGLIVISASDICIGSITSPLGLYLMFIVGSPNNIAPLSIRSLLSKIAPESESGKIFALLGALELIVPSFETYFLNSIFKYSIDFFPSLLFEIAAAMNFIPIIIICWIDLNHYKSENI